MTAEDNPIQVKIRRTESKTQAEKVSPYHRPVEIILSDVAWGQVNQHANEDMQNEAGGFLLGKLYDFDGQITIRIETAIRAKGSAANAYSIEFTPEAWQKMEAELKQLQTPLNLVGWYHTHLGLSAYFSETDYLMHERYFKDPWHVGMVIDPILGEQKFYRWDGDQVITAQSFLLEVSDLAPSVSPPNHQLGSLITDALRELKARNDPSLAHTTRLFQSLQEKMPYLSGEDALDVIVSFINRCTSANDNVLSELENFTSESLKHDVSIDVKDLTAIARRNHPAGIVKIQNGWFLQADSNHQLEMQSLSRASLANVKLRFEHPIRSITVDTNGVAYIALNDGKKQVYSFEDSMEKLARKVTLLGANVVVNMRKFSPEKQINATISEIQHMICGGRYLYILDDDSLLVYELKNGRRKPTNPEFLSRHSLTEIVRNSSATLLLTTDPTGNLYLMAPGVPIIWKYRCHSDQLAAFVTDEVLQSPVSLAAGWSVLSVLNQHRTSQIVEYNLLNQKRVGSRDIPQVLVKRGLSQIFTSNGQRQLYFLTHKGIYVG